MLCHTQRVEAFLTHSGKIVVVPDDNIDTDRIIPARFLSRVARSGYGELLFSDVRGEGFVLDRPEAVGASIMIVGTNFGCGSSREHAVWAIQQAGFCAVVARRDEGSPGYSDIFRQNAANCGLALIELPSNAHTAFTAAGTGAVASIDLPNQTISVGEDSFEFEIDAVTKQALIAGLDLIGTTLQYDDAIAAYESKHESFVGTR